MQEKAGGGYGIKADPGVYASVDRGTWQIVAYAL